MVGQQKVLFIADVSSVNPSLEQTLNGLTRILRRVTRTNKSGYPLARVSWHVNGMGPGSGISEAGESTSRVIFLHRSR